MKRGIFVGLVAFIGILLLCSTSLNTSAASIKSFKLGYGPYGITFNPSDGLLYVANFNSNAQGKPPYDTVSAINPTTGHVTTIDLIGNGFSPNPLTLTYDSQYKVVYVASVGGEDVQIIKGLQDVGQVQVPSSLPEQCSFDAGGGLFGIAYDTTNQRLYATCGGNGVTYEIRVTNATSARVVSQNVISSTLIPGQSSGLGDITYDSRDNLLFVAGNSSVLTIDPKTNIVTHVINDNKACTSFECFNTEISYDPANNLVYVSYVYNTGEAEVGCVNPKTLIMSGCLPNASINVGGYAYDSANKLLYVANFYPNTVSAISGTKIVANYSLPSQPYMLAYDSINEHIYATAGENSVYFVV